MEASGCLRYPISILVMQLLLTYNWPAKFSQALEVLQVYTKCHYAITNIKINPFDSSVEVFSTTVIIEDTEISKQILIVYFTETC